MPAERRHPSPAGTARDSGTCLRFNIVDEVVHLLDTEAEPWSIQLEVRVSGGLDEERTRAALRTAMERHPMARARKVPSRPTRDHELWEIPPAPDLDVLRLAQCPDDAALQTVRESLQSRSVPLVESPPLRAVLARHPGGDVLMLNLSHAATDGFGGVRLLQSIGRAYGGSADPLTDALAGVDRDLGALRAAPDTRTRIRRYLGAAQRLRDLADPPARVAADGGADRPGYGFHHVRLDAEATRRLVDADHPGSVNDLLLAALHLAIADWNERHEKPCRRICVLVPANLRGPQWREEAVGNFSLPARISTTPRQRTTPTRTLAAVTRQTARKKTSGLGTGLLEVFLPAGRLPLWAKQLLVVAIPFVGSRFVDTAILSNLGVLTDPPSFDGDPGEVWFSAPARMPLGLSVGAVTVSGRLYLAFRYRRPLFGSGAAEAFAEVYLTHLRTLAATA